MAGEASGGRPSRLEARGVYGEVRADRAQNRRAKQAEAHWRAKRAAAGQAAGKRVYEEVRADRAQCRRSNQVEARWQIKWSSVVLCQVSLLFFTVTDNLFKTESCNNIQNWLIRMYFLIFVPKY